MAFSCRLMKVLPWDITMASGMTKQLITGMKELLPGAWKSSTSTVVNGQPDRIVNIGAGCLGNLLLYDLKPQPEK